MIVDLDNWQSQLAGTLSDIRVWVVANFPFYGTLLTHLPFRKDEGAKTVYTDGRVIGYNPSFLRALDLPEIRFVVLHEVLHAALGHVFRRGTRDPLRWGIAADIVVNGILYDLAFRLRRTVLREPEGVLLDGPLAELGPVERVHDHIRVVRPRDFDEHRDGPREDLRANAEMWKLIVARAAQVAKRCGRGDYAGTLETLVEEMLRPRIPWTRFLASVAAEVLHDDYDWMEPDEELLQQGVIVPDLYREGVRVAFACDTSGSMSDEDLAAATSEGAALLRSRGVLDVLVLGCDAEIHYDRLHGPNDPMPRSWGGRGGTDFRPVFERLQGERGVRLLVYFTDLAGPFPEVRPPGCRVVWVSVTQDLDVPFGEAVRYEREEVSA